MGKAPQTSPFNPPGRGPPEGQRGFVDNALGTILVVEDDADHSALIQAVFRYRSPASVIRIASTGREALDYLEGLPPYNDRAKNPLPEVIILDLDLPGMNGFDVLSWLSMSAEHSKIPVVMFTASTDPADERKAFSLGAHAFKSKPENFGELVEVVLDAAGRQLGPDSLSSGDGDIDKVV